MPFPPPFPDSQKPQVDRLHALAVAQAKLKIVVLDDDPTGVQTVHDVSVYTDWSPASLAQGFAEPGNVFYLLTNSRAMTPGETAAAHREIIRNLTQAAAQQKREFLLVSRSDSTLRGHYPLETDILREGLETYTGQPVDGEILCFYFREGGRITVGDTHYVQDGGTLIPAADTEFAKDKTFGYTQSDLRRYIEEKTQGAVRAEDVHSLPLEQLRAMDIDGIATQLCTLQRFAKVVVNAADEYDLKVFCTALYRALANGKRFCCRTAASFVKIMAGIGDRPLLTRQELTTAAGGGIVMVGSHTAKTTAQLQQLLTLPQTEAVPLQSDLVLQEGALAAEVDRVTRMCDKLLAAGKTPVVYTARAVLSLPGDTREAALARSVEISHAVQAVVAGLTVTPAFIIAKGGITSSDIATKALHVRRADVAGQIAPGIPVWMLGAESRFPGIPYVIFPGNVGQDDTLREAAKTLIGAPAPPKR